MLSKLPKITKNKKKRLGRGGGSGKGDKSGRGTTRHQKARGKIPLHFEGGQAKITKKYPLLRGKSRNKSRQTKTIIIHLDELNVFKDGQLVDIKSLMEIGLVDKTLKNVKVKILNRGKLSKKIKLDVSASKSVIDAIKKI